MHCIDVDHFYVHVVLDQLSVSHIDLQTYIVLLLSHSKYFVVVYTVFPWVATNKKIRFYFFEQNRVHRLRQILS